MIGYSRSFSGTFGNIVRAPYRTIRKVMGEGVEKAKIKIARGKQIEKKYVHRKSLKKKSCRDFSIGKIIS
jgi:hypothetical protein